MERICKECGSLVNGEAKFCPVCGKAMERAVALEKQQPDVMPQQPGAIVNAPPVPPVSMAQPNQTGNSVGSSAGYGAPRNVTTQANAPYVQMTTGEWVLTIAVCTFFGLVSLILNIIWAFAADTPEPKRTYCRAMFFINIATTILGLIVGIGCMVYIGVWLGGAF